LHATTNFLNATNHGAGFRTMPAANSLSGNRMQCFAAGQASLAALRPRRRGGSRYRPRQAHRDR
jgi:hypothetical protein